MMHIREVITSSRSQGFALVVVMLTLVLVSVMATLFLSSAMRERRASHLYSQGDEVRHLAETAVNRAMATIAQASRESETAGQPVSWTSQPGLIRTFDTSGSGRNVYKLYSWANRQMAAKDFDPSAATERPPADWSGRPAQYTDLNDPVNDVYPIVDPRAAGNVEGFTIDNTDSIVSSASHNAPMPVQWLYALADGTLVAPTAAGADAVTVAGATETNPIVGRIAYWADDETSKVNINTASEGSYWDWPKAASRDELAFAGNPPVAGEYQRVAGHPAMTSLSAVFPELRSADQWANVANYRNEMAAIAGLSPRVAWGGSLGGTYPVESFTFDYAPPLSFLASNPPPAALAPSTGRLYATVDEFLFGSNRSLNSILSSRVGAGNVRQRSFFLTAHSKAPETTLFDTPRVSLWPVTWPWNSSYFSVRGGPPAVIPSPDTADLSANPWMTPEEKLLAFCATLNRGTAEEQRYFFQRQNPDSPSHDWLNIDRNRELFSYLDGLLSQPIPGYGGSFSAKYGGTELDAILLNAFDYLRTSVNQYTMGDDGRLDYSFTGVAFRNAASLSQTSYIEPNAFAPTPIRATINGTEHVAASNYPRLREAAVMFWATDRLLPGLRTPPPPGGSAPPNNPDPDDWENLINLGPAYGGVLGTAARPIATQTTEMRAVMILDFAQLDPGVIDYAPTFWVKVTGDSFEAVGVPINLPPKEGAVIQWNTAIENSRAPRNLNPFFFRDSSGIQVKTFNSSDANTTNWSLISDPISVPPVGASNLRFSFKGSEIKVEIFACRSDPDADPTGDSYLKVAEYDLDFSVWDGPLPVPLAPRWNVLDNEDKPVPWEVPGVKLATDWVRMELAPQISSPYDEAGDRNYPTLAPGAAPWQKPVFTNNNHKKRLTFYAFDSQSGQVSTNLARRLNILQGSTTYLARNTDENLTVFNTSNNSVRAQAFSLITPYDTVISMVLDPTGPSKGDYRVAEGATFVKIDDAHAGTAPPELISLSDFPRLNVQLHSLGFSSTIPFSTGYGSGGRLLSNSIAPDMATVGAGTLSGGQGKLGNRSDWQSIVGTESGSINLSASNSVGDWTSMPGNQSDGAYLARPDQEFQALHEDRFDKTWAQVPFFVRYGNDEGASAGLFSPNRQVPSPVLFGTLPSSRTKGWQTLLFSPNPAVGSSHPGLRTPPDHVLLDLFWMPVVEPYPISEQLATAGKVNLNYRMVPFDYIERKTGLHAVMKATQLTVLPNTAAKNYKSHYFMRTENPGVRTRLPLDIDETLTQFDTIFDNNDVFRSASQICEMYLVPEGLNVFTMQNSYWNGKELTSDTAREEPYNHLYSRLTTRSNTFKVHWKVQALNNRASANPAQWEEGRGRVEAELRGSTLIERYLDANATDIPDYSTDPTAMLNQPLSSFYRWRVISNTRFTP